MPENHLDRTREAWACYRRAARELSAMQLDHDLRAVIDEHVKGETGDVAGSLLDGTVRAPGPYIAATTVLVRYIAIVKLLDRRSGGGGRRDAS